VALLRASSTMVTSGALCARNARTDSMLILVALRSRS
jgi:hypothetical protein